MTPGFARGFAPFLILALPRSRTAWLAHYLNYDPARPIGHDIGIECRTVLDFINSYRYGMIGTVETGAVIAQHLITAHVPGLRRLVVKRPLEEIRQSLAAFGIEAVPGQLEERYDLLNLVAREPGVEVVEFRDLGIPETGKFIFEWALGRAWDPDWFAKINAVNIQIDMVGRIQQLGRNAATLRELKDSIRHVQV